MCFLASDANLKKASAGRIIDVVQEATFAYARFVRSISVPIRVDRAGARTY